MSTTTLSSLPTCNVCFILWTLVVILFFGREMHVDFSHMVMITWFIIIIHFSNQWLQIGERIMCSWENQLLDNISIMGVYIYYVRRLNGLDGSRGRKPATTCTHVVKPFPKLHWTLLVLMRSLLTLPSQFSYWTLLGYNVKPIFQVIYANHLCYQKQVHLCIKRFCDYNI